MEMFDELLLSLITILFALLIAKIAPAAAELCRHHSKVADRSVELEELGRRRDRSENVDADVGSSGVEKVGEVLVERLNEARSDEFDLEMEKNREGKESQVDDVIIEEGVQESEGCLKIGKVDAVLVRFDVEEEERSEEVDLVMVESVKKLEETVKFEVGEEGKTQLIDFYRDESMKELETCGGDADLVKEAVRLPEMRTIDEEGFGRGERKSGIEEKEGSLLFGEDEWEGIEKNELEKLFEMAVEYVGSEDGGNALSKLSSDVQKQLYGLHKVATEGPCYEPQPLALKVMARAKWHSWQRLGNMNPDTAMEQYIALLSKSIPGWVKEKHKGKCDDIPDAGVSRIEVPDLSSFLHDQPKSSGTQRAFEEPSCVEVEETTSSPNLFAKGLTKTAFLFDLLSPTTATFLTLYS